MLVVSMSAVLVSSAPTPNPQAASNPTQAGLPERTGQVIVVNNATEMRFKNGAQVPEYLTFPVNPSVYKSHNTSSSTRSRRDVTPACPITWHLDYNANRYGYPYIWYGQCNGSGTTCTKSGVPSCTSHNINAVFYYFIGYTPEGYPVYQEATEQITVDCSCSA